MEHHGHDHGAHGHHHSVSPDADASKLAIALALIAGFMVVEVVAGVLASSLALLSDSAHMLTDAAALGLSLVAARLAARPARGALTFGLGRAEVLSAQANGLTLLVLGLVIMVEGVRRLAAPPDVDAPIVLIVGICGMVVNVAAAWVLAKAERRSLNVEGAYQHVLTDLFAAMGTVVAALVIIASGWDRADPVASIFVSLLMLRSAYGLLRATGRVILEAAPEGIDVEEIGRALVGVPGVREVHDLHVWEVTTGFPALSAHVLVGRDSDCHATRRELEEVLHDRFELTHTTLQVDHEGGDLLSVGVSDALAQRP